jgi:hypothetical protein
VLTAVTSAPAGSLVSSNLAAGTATVTVTIGATTIVTFTDAATAATSTLQVCKVAGPGIVIGTNFTFSVAGNPVVIPAGAAPGGSCTAVVVPAGPVVVTEAILAGTVLAGVSSAPAGSLVSSILAAGTATVTVTTGTTTSVTFTNAAFVAPAQVADTAYQIAYAANLNIGDSVVNMSNDGLNGGFFTGKAAGSLCVNVYTFDPSEEEISCCYCLVTPDGLNSLSAKSDLISNTLTPAVPQSIIIKLVATPGDIPCNPAAPLFPTNGLLAWGTTLEPAGSPGTYGVVHVPFLNGHLGAGEQADLANVCAFVQSEGTGFGVCNSCRLGALGGTKQ